MKINKKRLKKEIIRNFVCAYFALSLAGAITYFSRAIYNKYGYLIYLIMAFTFFFIMIYKSKEVVR